MNPRVRIPLVLPPGAPYKGEPRGHGGPAVRCYTMQVTIYDTMHEKTTGVSSSLLDVTRHGYSAGTLVTSMAL